MILPIETIDMILTDSLMNRESVNMILPIIHMNEKYVAVFFHESTELEVTLQN
jgi:hypothetical protein